MFSSRSTNLPAMREILELAKILRKDGDQVLNGTSKLSLSTKLLHNLNDAFSLIVDDSKDLESSFQVCSSSEIDVFRDLKFLHDFVQKTIWLKIVHSTNDPGVIIDISKFRHLRYLELEKVSIDVVNGIQAVRGQLENISCSGARGVVTIGRLLTACGGDAGVGFIWASLKRLALPYNGLGRLDKSLELVPWLQILDLSHNFITIATELECLPNLKYVNLSYNKLEAVPTFNKSAYRTLHVLVLKNNHIEHLNGLQGLDCLAELDLSCNCLADHSILWPLETMTTLLWVSLHSNPLAYHPRHRHLTIKHLHSSLAESKFVLDHLPLSKSEKFLVSENRHFTIRSVPALSADDSTSLSASITSEITGGSMRTNDMTSSQIIDNMEKSYSKTTKRRQTNVLEVNIADGEMEKEREKMDSTILSSLETSTEHLETKKKILALREKFGGENWLSSHAGSFVQDIMGMPSSAIMSSSTSSSMNLYRSVNSSSNDETPQDIEDTRDNETQETVENADDSTIEETISPPQQEQEVQYDPEEEHGDLFIVQKKKNDTDLLERLFLIITSDDIKERDAITGNIKYRWSIDSVLSCVMGRGDSTTIDFIFDTTRRDRQSRMYFAEPEDAAKIVKTIGELMKTRPIILKVFKCMKCSTHFSQDPDCLTLTTTNISNIKSPICPSCKSTLVIQTDDLLTPDVDIESKISSTPGKIDLTKNSIEQSSFIGDIQHSSSQSSIGGTEGGASRSVTTPLVHSDYRPQVQICCSATSLDDSRGSTSSTLMKKYDSDIEVLSNPSQSSIEVLDDGIKSSSTPKRKRSSEERRIAITPSLLTIPDIAPVMAGLTESSSSGSLTDSICTAYENRQLKTTASLVVSESDQSGNLGSIKEQIHTPVVNLTSMLGGLLQSMKIGPSKESPVKYDDGEKLFASEIMQYSYTNFTSVDHRIKLHLILNIFELENEELVLFVRSEILLQNQTTSFAGCLVWSTLKIYILRIIGPEGDDPQRWLLKEISWTIDRLRTFSPLPFKQGVLFELEQPSKVNEESNYFRLLCVLQDFQRTSNLLLYLTDLPLPSCEIEFTIPEQHIASIHGLMTSLTHHRDDDAVRIFALFTTATIQLGEHLVKLRVGGLLVTTTSLALTEDNIRWLLPDSSEKPVKLTEQVISNLIEVILDGASLGLSFLDEVAGVEELWTLIFASTGAAEAVICAIQSPWEQLFSIPLQITVKSPQSHEENTRQADLL